MTIEKIFSSIPVNKTADIVTKKGFHFDRDVKHALHSSTPLQIRGRRYCEKVNKSWVDLTGYKYGWFTVIGISADLPKRWVVRCVCGSYEVRRASVIKNPKSNNDKCYECRFIDDKQAYYKFKERNRFIKQEAT